MAAGSEGMVALEEEDMVLVDSAAVLEDDDWLKLEEDGNWLELMDIEELV